VNARRSSLGLRSAESSRVEARGLEDSIDLDGDWTIVVLDVGVALLGLMILAVADALDVDDAELSGEPPEDATCRIRCC